MSFLPRPVLANKGVYTFQSTLSGKHGGCVVQCTKCKTHTCALTKREVGMLVNHFQGNNTNFELKLRLHKSSKHLVMPNPSTLSSSLLKCKSGMVPCIFCAAKQREIFAAVVVQPKNSQEDRVQHLESELGKKAVQINMLLDSLKSSRKTVKEVSTKAEKSAETMKKEVYHLKCHVTTLRRDCSDSEAKNNALHEDNMHLQAELRTLNDEVQNMWRKPCGQSNTPLWNYSLLWPDTMEKILRVEKDPCGLGTLQL